MTVLRPLIVLPALALLAASGCGGSDGGGTKKSSTASATQSGGTLFAQKTGSGTLTSKGGGLELTLRDPAEAVTTFSDRPERITSRESLQTFVGDWTKRGFASDPPNAALIAENGGRERTVVLELSHPRLRGGRLTYSAKRIEQAGGPLAGIAPKGSSSFPASFKSGQLFIDDAGGQLVPIPVNLTTSSSPTAQVRMTFDDPAQTTANFSFSVGGGRTNGGLNGQTVSVNGSGQFQIPLSVPIPSLQSPITGSASLEPGAAATVSVNGGPNQQLKSGRFSFNPNLGAGAKRSK